jgi:hypothetical protein
MSVLSGSRADRPFALALVVTLVTLLLAPVLMPAPASADVVGDITGALNPCNKGKVAKAVCNGVGDAAGGAIDGVEGIGGALASGAKDATDAAIKGVKAAGGTLVDGAKWFGKGVGTIAGKAWDVSKPWLAKAAALGLIVGGAIVCSKAAKIVAATSAAVATAPETAGAGSAAGAAAGWAGTAAVCTLIKKGGKAAIKVAFKNGGKLAKLAKLAAGATGLAALVLGTQHAAAWLLTSALDVDKPSAPNLGSSWMASIRQNLNGLAGVLLVVAAMVGLMFAGFSGRISDVGRVLSGMIGAALIIGIVGSLLFASLQVSDTATQGAVESRWGQQALGNWSDLGSSYANASPTTSDQGGSDANKAQDDPAQAQEAGQGTPPDDGKGPWVLRFVIMLLTAFAGALVWLELQIRDGLLMVLLLFSGLMLAGYAFERLRHLATGFALTMLGVVVAKPILVITLLLGGAQMQNAAKTTAILPMLTGAGLMLLAGVLGMKVVTWMGMQGHLVEKGAMRARSASSGGGIFGRGSNGGQDAQRQNTPDAAAESDPSNEAPAARHMTEDGADRVNRAETDASAATASVASAGSNADSPGDWTVPTAEGAQTSTGAQPDATQNGETDPSADGGSQGSDAAPTAVAAGVATATAPQAVEDSQEGPADGALGHGTSVSQGAPEDASWGGEGTPSSPAAANEGASSSVSSSDPEMAWDTASSSGAQPSGAASGSTSSPVPVSASGPPVATERLSPPAAGFDGVASTPDPASALGAEASRIEALMRDDEHYGRGAGENR